MSQDALMQPTILLVEPDDTVRPILIDNLRNWGYDVIVVLDGADAIQRTRSRSERFDLLLLSQFGQSIESLIAIARDVRQQAGLLNAVPVVVIAEHYGADLEGQNVQLGEHDYVTYLENGQQLRALLHLLCPGQDA